MEYQYFNNPVRFIQSHIELFIMEWQFHKRYPQKMKTYEDINLRWLLAEQYLEGKVQEYQISASKRAGLGGGGVSTNFG